MEELDKLRRELKNAMSIPREVSNNLQGSVVRLERIFKIIIARHDGNPVDFGEYDVSKLVKEFRIDARISTYRDFIKICRAASYRLQDQWCIMDSSQHIGVLHSYVDTLARHSQRIKAFRELLFPYLNYIALGNGGSLQPHVAYTQILRKLYTAFSKDLEHISPWFEKFRVHKNILSDNPADVYAEAITRGESTQIDTLLKDLAIPADSWLICWLLKSLMEKLETYEDQQFKAGLNNTLVWIRKQSALDRNKNAVIAALSIALSRYARCADSTEHPGLLQLSLSLIGNPWIEASKWAALVQENGRPDEKARKMVDGWLKRTFISDFYSILQQNAQTDKNRLKYWLRFQKHINDLWFALDDSIYYSKQKTHIEFRERATGRLSVIDRGNGASAFIMLIGDYYFVEFSQIGNSCFVYKKHVLESLLGAGFFSRTAVASLNIKQLKEVSATVLKLTHRNDWFGQFDDKFENIIPRIMAQIPTAF